MKNVDIFVIFTNFDSVLKHLSTFIEKRILNADKWPKKVYLADKILRVRIV